MNKNDFLNWLQGYISGITGTELSQSQIDAIRNNLNRLPNITPTQPAVYTEAMAAEDDELLAGVSSHPPSWSEAIDRIQVDRPRC